MIKRRFKIVSVLLSLFAVTLTFAQQTEPGIHSHNDYKQNVPFWTAYATGCTSIEIDLVLQNNTLYVAHSPDEISKEKTLSSVYLKPLYKVFQENGNKAYKDGKELQLLIDLKTEALPSTQKLVEVLEQYSPMFNPQKTSHPVKVVVSGNTPPSKDWKTFPTYLCFDGRTPADAKNSKGRVPLVSRDFADFTVWNGKGRPVEKELNALQNFVKNCHEAGAKVRFWNTPDDKSAYNILYKMGVDFINTDHPAKVSKYLKEVKEDRYKNNNTYVPYTPKFAVDNDSTSVKNIIFFVGDGMGSNQLASGYYANNYNLVCAKFKHIGFSSTNSADNFATDSAAGATAFACGHKTRNRYIGMDTLGLAMSNIMEILQKKGMKTGFVTTDRVTGATPAAFYAHQTERDMNKEIFQDLLKSKLDFAAGGKPGLDLSDLGNFSLIKSTSDNIDKNKPTMFLIKYDKQGHAQPTLAELTKLAIKTLNNEKGFFLMIECSGIDSGGHGNDFPKIVNEVIELDKAISEATRFADEDGQTLIVVTADHETGGLVLPDADVKNNVVEGHFYSNDHTGSWVPVLSYGPHSSNFSGIYPNTHLFTLMNSLIGQ